MTFVFVVMCKYSCFDLLVTLLLRLLMLSIHLGVISTCEYLNNSSAAGILNGSNSVNLLDWLSIPNTSVNSILILVEPKQTG